jgi:hypothetical protein
MPSIDEWHWIPVLTGQERLTWQGLWARWAEHRLVLARLSLWLLDRALGYNLWSGAVVNIAIFGALAFFLIRAARRDRGSTSFSDAFFAIILLRFFPLLTNNWVIHNTEWTLIAGTLLLIIHSHPQPLPLGTALVVGFLLLIFPLAGAMGLTMVPALAIWLALSGVFWWRAGRHKANGGVPAQSLGRTRITAVVILSLALAATLWLPFYFRGLTTGQSLGPPQAGPLATMLAGALAYMTTGLGPAAGESWPVSGIVCGGLLAAGLMVLAQIWMKKPEERFRLAGLFFFLAAVGSLALGTAWGRGGLGVGACLARRYGSMSVIAWCALYLLAGVDPTLRAGRWLQYGLFLVACCLFPFNMENGFRTAQRVRAAQEAVETDIRAGVPATMVIERHSPLLVPNWNGVINPWNQYFVLHGMQALRQANFGAFAQLRDDPAYAVSPVVPELREAHDMSWEGGVARVTGPDPFLAFVCPARTKVYAIVLNISGRYENGDAGPVHVSVSWQAAGAAPNEGSEAITLEPGMEQKNVIWVDGFVNGFQIRLEGRPALLRIAQIQLVVSPQAP